MCSVDDKKLLNDKRYLFYTVTTHIKSFVYSVAQCTHRCRLEETGLCPLEGLSCQHPLAEIKCHPYILYADITLVSGHTRLYVG